MKKSLIALAFILVSFSSWAQKGIIKGSVTDGETGEEIIGASVVIAGTTTGSATDVFGHFEFSAEPGTYEINVTYIGYSKFIIQALEVTAGEEVTLNIKMKTDAQQLEEIVVVGKADRTSNEMLLIDRKNSSLAVENIGASELSSKGVSDVGTGVSKLAGVSKMSSKGIYVRGLGDRYNNVYLNSVPVLSPDPLKKLINLDIFPTSIVRNIGANKIYRVDQFGDMAGASVDIFTKDSNEDAFFTAKLGMNYNTATTGNDFKIQKDGDNHYFGFNGSGRKEPELRRTGNLFEFVETNRDPFNTGLDSETITAPIDNSFSLQGGKTFDIGNNNSLGFIASGSFRNSYRSDNGPNNVSTSTNVLRKKFERERDQYSSNLTTLLGTELVLKDKHHFNINYLFVNNSYNGFITSQGITDEIDDPENFENRKTRSRYEQQQLNNIQFLARHELTEKLDVKYGMSFANGTTVEPDRRDLSFRVSKGETDQGSMSSSAGGVNQRYYQDTDEDETYFFAEGGLKFGNLLKEEDEVRHKLVFGVQRRDKKRDINFRTYQYNLYGSLVNKTIDLNNLNATFTDQNYVDGLYDYTIVIDGSKFSNANRTINAGYAYLDLKLNDKLQIIPGVRVEDTYQEVNFKREGSSIGSDYEKFIVNEVDLLPAVSIKYAAKQNKIVRFGVSKTLIRPNFRELIPIGFVNENLQSTVGNPELENSEVYNVDLKYELFNETGGLFSVGAYYKYIDSPMEQVQGPNFITFDNMKNAPVVGAEVEFRKRFSDIFHGGSKFIEGLTLDGNLSYMYSNVDTEGVKINVTNTNRQLQGASPYIVNVSLGYDRPFGEQSSESSVVLSFNTFGDRIYSAGSQNIGDEMELSYNTLDFVFSNKWNSGFGIKLSARNLLNPERVRSIGTSETAANSVTTVQYKTGVNLGVSLSYDLF